MNKYIITGFALIVYVFLSTPPLLGNPSSIYLINSDTLLPQSVHYQLTEQVEGLLFADAGTATLFIGGAVFNGKEKSKQRNINFTQNLIHRLKNFFHPSGKYRTARKSKRFLGFIRNSIYSLKFGNDILDRKKLKKKGRHRAMRKTIKEAYKFSRLDKTDNYRLNIIGSSYGTVVAAHIALKIIEGEKQKVNALILAASPIDHIHSKLGKRLKHHHDSGKIGQIIWLPNENDNVTGASGNISVWKLVFPSNSSGNKTIINPHHPHNKARKNISRAKVIIDNIVTNNLNLPVAAKNE